MKEAGRQFHTFSIKKNSLNDVFNSFSHRDEMKQTTQLLEKNINNFCGYPEQQDIFSLYWSMVSYSVLYLHPVLMVNR